MPQGRTFCQSEDQGISEIVEVLQGHCNSVSSTEDKFLCREKSRLVLRDGLLFRKRQVNDDLMHQLVLPPNL